MQQENYLILLKLLLVLIRNVTSSTFIELFTINTHYSNNVSPANNTSADKTTLEVLSLLGGGYITLVYMYKKLMNFRGGDCP
jgi:hypothetical protein